MTEDPRVNDFLRRYAEDQRRGIVRSRQEYLDLFPGAEDDIAEELDLLTDDDQTERLRIGGYEIISLVGRGGQGVVYRARDPKLGRTVALKVLSGRGAWSRDSLERFRREAQVASKIDHNGICTIYETGELDGTPFIAMRFLEGENLAERISDAILAPDRQGVLEFAGLVEQAARALHAAHEKGVIHRDVKPANLMLGDDGGVVVMDFGLARDDESDLATLTASGDLFGTPAYMSPEQLGGGSVRPDRRTDVWSLGATLYEGVTGSRPFRSPTREGLFHAILSEEPTNPRQLNRAVPADIAVVLETALRKNLARRYQSALDLAEDLRRVREGEPILARPISFLGRLVRWTRREPFKAAAVLIAVIAAVALLIQSKLSESAIRAERDLAIARKAEFDQLAGVVLLDNATMDQEELYPPWPEMVPAMERWLEEDAARIVALEPTLLETVASIERRVDRLPAREQDAGTPRYRFADDSEEFLYNTISHLAEYVREFERGEIADVKRRLAWARRLGELTRDHPNARVTWEDARLALRQADGVVASSLYREQPIDLLPQMGLVPLGMNPATGLWEFYHLRTAYDPGAGGDPADIRIPEYGDDGTLDVDANSGLVFVLIPGGTFWMGSQAAEPAGRNFDPDAEPLQSFAGQPIEVTLAPFFLSRYELTQGQWLRLGEVNPSFYANESPADGPERRLAHPVERLSWHDITLALNRLRLRLPTESQWEYACRAGTQSIFSTGDTIDSLQGFANIADEASRSSFTTDWRFETGLDDGYDRHAPVGSLKPNAFGLHDMHGNVWEWCMDTAGDYDIPPDEGDGERPFEETELRSNRGGSFSTLARFARSADRSQLMPDTRRYDVGARPARDIH